MSPSFEVRVGAVAGWIALVGIVTLLIAIPMALAGQPPTVNTDPAAVMAYFRHPELAIINGVLAVFVGIVATVAFGYGLRSWLRSGSDVRARVMADLGFALLLVSAPIYLVSGALGAMLVQAADGDPGTFASLFRLYDVTYNGGADVMEGAWIGAFSLAALWSPLPRWIGWLGLAVLATRWVKAFIPFAPVPEAIALLGGLVFIAWFVVVVVALSRAARSTAAPARVAVHPAMG
jgi:hypothetical protein